MTKIVIISDTHGYFPVLPDGDVLIHCGDALNYGSESELRKFADWMDKQPHTTKLYIPGNHDRILEQEHAFAIQLLSGVNVLLNESITVDGIKFYGSPYTPDFRNWAFMLPRNSKKMQSNWDMIPHDIDVLISHGPPKGILDTCLDGYQAGCEMLLTRVLDIKPRYHVFGHIHGQGALNPVVIGTTTFINASICNEAYQPIHAPQVVYL